jgi:thiol:disulfide interchange protein DsbD
MNILRYIFSGILVFLSVHLLSAQKVQPVSWSFEWVSLDDDNIEITAKATMKSPWVIYSQNTEEGGPIPTSFRVNGEEEKWEELSQAKTEFDELFEVHVTKFANTAVFSKKIKKGNVKDWTIEVEFMTCDGEKCLPPAVVTQTISL